ncbi:MAG: GNAT family N-acetyltransferase [Candidatus Pacebacteria bacterium]|jgi:GNAT superfamily N-acetyltransferase|nr:GNAT family N-acetyltransferase [Candidatus Paceibacterota bacterium]MBT4652354.1 GNAT family N-acetyltransferase [Candidatus Paceibacterota bacterium]MBT6756181.1 GNAT family N-acetyltransferase [Candidatus Paceibacterota bacterium]MBT6921472.1 GNAT family N-acetyltransferase [Candidatus Paceibacterota bacterium]
MTEKNNKRLDSNLRFLSILEDESIASLASAFLLKLYESMGLSIDEEYVGDLADINFSFSREKGNFFVITSEENDVVATTAYLLRENNVAYLTRLAVAPEYRKKGLARFTYKKMVEEMKARGIKKAVFSTLKSFGMVEAYKRWGFSVVSEEKIVTGRGDDIEVVMENILI